MLPDKIFPAHPHRQLKLSTLQSLSKSSADFTAKPNLSAALAKLGAALDSKSSAHSTITKQFFTRTVVPLLERNTPLPSIPAETASKWNAANQNCFDNLPQSEWFPVIDFLRVAALSSQVAIALLPSITTCLNKVTTPMDQADLIPKATLITSLKLMTNSAPLIFFEHRSALTRLAIDGLLHLDASARTPAASLVFRMAQLECSRRVDWIQSASEESEVDEAWEVECVSAVLESLAQETNGDVGKSATLSPPAKHAYLGPQHID